MESTFGPPSDNPTPWDISRSATRLAQPAILVVEDDRDIREMMATLLGMARKTLQARIEALGLGASARE